ncbi:MAG: ABC transporter permease [Nanoarchaeota archaeon]
MMKFFTALSKNFKVLFRQKTSLISIILGSLLIIFLIGIAFNSSSTIDITIGYHAPDNSTLSNEFIDVLEKDDYTTKPYLDNSSCIEDLKNGIAHTCIIFPEDFKIKKRSTENIEFIVDNSRMNLVYTVIEKVSERIDLKKDQLSMNLTSTLTGTMDESSKNIDSALGTLIQVKKRTADQSDEVVSVSKDLENVDLGSGNISMDVKKDISDIEKSQSSLYDDISSTVTSARDVISVIRSKENVSHIENDLADLEDDIDNINETAFTKTKDNSDKITDLMAKINDASSKIDTLKSKLESASGTTKESIESLDEVSSSLDSINDDLDTIKVKLEKAHSALKNVDITSSEQIINPVQTTIKTVSSSNNISMLFPYVLILIIMFVGLLLSSTLVVVEKKSKAAFRVFTTPTRDEFFIITTFITSFIIVLFQTLIILGAVGVFGVDLIGANLPMNILILILASSIFIMLGMCLGYLLPTQQSSNMASISLGAIFLFLSNLVLPLENISPYLRNIAEFNPYVLSSEALRQSILFSMDMSALGFDIAILFGYSIVIFIIIIFVQKISKMHFLKNSSHLKHDKMFHPHSFWFDDMKIDDEKDLIILLKKIDDKKYSSLIKKHNKAFKRFMVEELDQPHIAKNLKKYSKNGLLQALVKKNEDIIAGIEKSLHERKEKSKQK